MSANTNEISEEMRARFERALRDPHPLWMLYALARALKDKGVSQVTMYKLFDEFRMKLENDDRYYDAIVDNMEFIWGGSIGKRCAIFDTELKQSDLA